VLYNLQQRRPVDLACYRADSDQRVDVANQYNK
jgi:hypothetical protein